jgi:RNA polymerase sigma-70 factor (ECF subfamily)
MPISVVSDEQILTLLQEPKTQEQGFRLLMQQHQERLYWHIRRMVIEHEDANDVLQNCLVKAFRSIHKFEGKSSLFTWLYRIATNESLTFLSKKGRRATSSIDDETANLGNRLRADEYFDGDAIQIRLKKALTLLPEKQRIVFNLRYYEEMSYQDMSDVLGTSVGALKASFHHAVKKIETYFKETEN